MHTQFAVCVGMETEFAVAFQEAIVACSFMHMDGFGSMEAIMERVDSASCEFNDYFQYVFSMKSCMLAHMEWVVEGEIQADPIKAFFGEAIAADGDDSPVDVS